jgi:hypothetical protein
MTAAEIGATPKRPDVPVAAARPASIYGALARGSDTQEEKPQQITVRLRATGDKERDRRRIKTIYGTLISFHGPDRFSFHIFEDGQAVLLDFPGESTRICPEMLTRLEKLTGETNWTVEDITFH